MSEQHEHEIGADGPTQRRVGWREVRRQAAYLALTAAIVTLTALALAALATALQATRDEARSADLALVVAPAVPPAALADHAFELYRRGYVPTLVIAGAGQAGLKAQLVERGLPEASLISEVSETDATAELRRVARGAQAGGAASMIVVTEPGEMLRALKIVRDQGLRAYGSPAPGEPYAPLILARASLRYWAYVLLGL